MKNLDEIEEYIETACGTRVIHVTELATLVLDLLNETRHITANQQQMITHLHDMIKDLKSDVEKLRKV